MPQLAGALGQRREHSVSMGDGFVAGQVQSTRQILRRLDGLFFHAKILARWLTSFRAPPIHAKFAVLSFAVFPRVRPFPPVLTASFLPGTGCTTP